MAEIESIVTKALLSAMPALDAPIFGYEVDERLRFDSISELQEYKGLGSTLKINIAHAAMMNVPRTILYVSKDGNAWLGSIAGLSDEQQLSVFGLVKQVCDSRYNRFQSILEDPPTPVFGICCGLLLTSLYVSFKLPKPRSAPWLAVAVLMSLYLAYLSLGGGKKPVSFTHFRATEHDNADRRRMWIEKVSLLIAGGIITLFVQWAMAKFKR